MTRAAFLLFLLPLLSLLLTVAVSAVGSGGPPDLFLPSTKPTSGNGKERLTHLHFFWHDTSAGPDPSAVVIAQSQNQSATNFGTMRVMDDPLTAGPNRSSRLIGKSQGIYVSADQETFGLLMVMTLTFTVGKYNGSTLVVVGRNEVEAHVREMAITGGTGKLRFVNGYARAQTHSYDPTNSYYIVEYDCYFVTPAFNSSAAEHSSFI